MENQDTRKHFHSPENGVNVSELATLGRQFPVPWLFATGDGVLRYANAAALALVGCSSSELVGRQLSDFLDDEDTSANMTAVFMAAMQGVAGGFDCLRPDYRVGGERRWFHVFVTPESAADKAGGGLFILAVDINAQKRADIRARSATHRLQHHVETSASALVELDADLRIRQWSTRAETMFGVSSKLAIGKTPRELSMIAPESVDSVESLLHLRATDGGPSAWTNRNRNFHSDGSVLWCDWYNSVTRDEAGAVSVLAIAVEVTAQVAALQSLDEKLAPQLPQKLINRAALQQLVDSAPASKRQALICLSLQKLHHINHRYGFAFGDEVLRIISQRLQHNAAPGETIARHNGVDFLILCKPDLNETELTRRALDAVAAFESPISINDTTVEVACFAGISDAQLSTHSFQEMLRQADIAAHRCRRLQGPRVSRYSKSVDDAALARHERAVELRAAIRQGHIKTFFQPILDVATDRIIGAECLARWEITPGTWVSPAEFVPIAEDYNLIHELGLLVFAKGCAFAKRMNTDAATPFVVSVNVSPKQLALDNFLDDFRRVMTQTGVRANTVRLELTESQELVSERTMAMLRSLLWELDLECVVDDFGVGYSNLSRVIDLPIRGIKIDLSIVARTDARSRALLCSITAMAQSIGVSVTAEGVEQPETLAALKALGCDSYQGFLFSEAIPEEAFATRLRDDWTQRPN